LKKEAWIFIPVVQRRICQYTIAENSLTFMDVGPISVPKKSITAICCRYQQYVLLRKLITSYYKQEDFTAVPITQKLLSIQPLDIDMRLVLNYSISKSRQHLTCLDD
jgi:hypothetical protein